MIVLGIVGSPAGGKSTVAGFLAELGGTWVNADLIARDVLETDQVELQLVDHFGPAITGEGGRIDRKRLASRVFGDDDLSRSSLIYLESVIHPRTREIITGRLRQTFVTNPDGSIVILDIPLLFEAGWDRYCDEIVCVRCMEATRRERVRARGWSDEELRRREKNQWPIAEKQRLSTKVIHNDGELGELRKQLTDWHSSHLTSRVSPGPTLHTNC